MWQVHDISHGAHLVRRVVYPLMHQHGRHVLQQVLDVDAAQVVRTAGARRIRIVV